MKIYSNKRQLTIDSVIGKDIWVMVDELGKWFKFVSIAGDYYIVHVASMFYVYKCRELGRLVDEVKEDYLYRIDAYEKTFNDALRDKDFYTTEELFGARI